MADTITPYVPGDERNQSPNQDYTIDTTYHSGGLIRAVDYNLLADEIREVLDDLNEDSTSVLVGGFGYGVPTALPTKVTDEFIGYSEWAQLLSAIDVVVAHQGTVSSMPSVVAFGEYAEAYDDAQTGMIAVMEHVRSNRFELADSLAYESIDGAMLTDQRTNPWTDTLNWEWNVEFANFNDMRRYFNTGSEIRFSIERVGGISSDQQYYVGSNDPYFNSNVYANAWDAFLEGIGDISISADKSYRPLGDNYGTFNVTTGFYGIIDTLAQGGAGVTWLKIYEAVGSYGSEEDKVEVYARLNAAPVAATQIQFKITLISESGPTYVDGTLVGKVDHRTSVNSKIPSPTPTFATTTSLSVGEESTSAPTEYVEDDTDNITPVTIQSSDAIIAGYFQSDSADATYSVLDQVEMDLFISNTGIYFQTKNREGEYNQLGENIIISSGVAGMTDTSGYVPTSTTTRITDGAANNTQYLTAIDYYNYRSNAVAMLGTTLDANNLWIWHGILPGEGDATVLSAGGSSLWQESNVQLTFGWNKLSSTFVRAYSMKFPSPQANGGSPQAVYGRRYTALRNIPIYLAVSTTTPAQPNAAAFAGLGSYVSPNSANIQLPDNVYKLFSDISFYAYL